MINCGVNECEILCGVVTEANERAINEEVRERGSLADHPHFRPWIGSLGCVAGADSGPHPCRACQIVAEQKPVAKPAAKTDAAAVAAPSSGAKPATVKVEKGSFKTEVALTGVFEAERLTEVSLRPKAWALPLVVERAIELGTPVKKGDILVEFDHDKIDKAIQDTEVENTLGDLALKQAEEELPMIEKAAYRST